MSENRPRGNVCHHFAPADWAARFVVVAVCALLSIGGLATCAPPKQAALGDPTAPFGDDDRQNQGPCDAPYCSYKSAWADCDEYFIMNAKRPAKGPPEGAKTDDDRCPTVAYSCQTFLARNHDRGGTSRVDAYFTNSNTEARCFMASAPCSFKVPGGPAKVAYFTKPLSTKRLEGNLVQYKMQCEQGTAVRSFFFDISAFEGQPACYSAPMEGALDPCKRPNHREEN